jgi:stress-induced morphogen
MSERKVTTAIEQAILERIPDAVIEVEAKSAGHFTIAVVSPVFSGKNMLESQRLVYGAIAHLMKGDAAPVHAIDRLTTRAPTG